MKSGLNVILGRKAGRKVGGVSGEWFVCVCEEREGEGATAAGQQLILSRETGSARSGQEWGCGGQKVVTPGVKEQTSQRGTSSKAKAPPGDLV